MADKTINITHHELETVIEALQQRDSTLARLQEASRAGAQDHPAIKTVHDRRRHIRRVLARLGVSPG